jgi:hypothetical protein
MSGTRAIVWGSTANPGKGGTIYSDAQTKGELFASNPDATKPGDKGYALSDDFTKLPEGNATLYFLVDKNDSGRG